MPEKTHNRGRIEVAPAAIANIANQAVLSCYGVVGTADKDLAIGIVNLLSPDSKRGIEVHIKGDEIVIDVYIIVEYGTRIVAVARSVMNVVKFSVERALGIRVSAVNVHVEGLRISDTD